MLATENRGVSTPLMPPGCKDLQDFVICAPRFDGCLVHVVGLRKLKTWFMLIGAACLL